MNRNEREPRFTLEDEVRGLGESIEALRIRTQIIGFFGTRDISQRETNGSAYQGWNIEQNTGEDRGLRLCYDIGHDQLSTSTAQLMDLREVNYRIYIPRREGDTPLRGSMFGWHYFNRYGEIAKVSDIAAEDLRDTDKVVAAYHNGGVAIVDKEAYDREHAPGNLEAMGISIQRFTKQLDDISSSIK